MGILSFDPNRVSMLRRSLEEMVLRLDSCLRLTADVVISQHLHSARAIAQLQLERVEDSLREILSGSTTSSRTCRTVDSLVRSYEFWADHTAHWWTQATTQQRTRGDDILAALACRRDPNRAGDLIDSLESLEVLVLGSADLEMLEGVWLQATDPLLTPPDVAARRIQRLLGIVFDDRPWEKGIARGSIDAVERSRREVELHRIVARVCAPWQLHFVGSSTWTSTRQWSDLTGARRLHQLMELESASDILVSDLPRAVMFSASVLPDDPHDRRLHIDSLARAIGTAVEVRRLAQTRRADAESGVETLRRVLGTLAIDGPWPLSLLVEAGADWVGDYFDSTDDRIRTAALEALTRREVLASIAVICVWNAAHVRARRRGSESSGTREISPAELASELRFTYQAIDNAAGRGQTLAQVSVP